MENMCLLQKKDRGESILNEISDEFCRFKRAVIYATVPLTTISSDII